MNLIELTEYLVKNLVKNTDDVQIKETTEGDYIIIEVKVNEADMGAVIGKSGKIANALRTIVQASAYANDKKRVRVNIDAI